MSEKNNDFPFQRQEGVVVWGGGGQELGVREVGVAADMRIQFEYFAPEMKLFYHLGSQNCHGCHHLTAYSMSKLSANLTLIRITII